VDASNETKPMKKPKPPTGSHVRGVSLTKELDAYLTGRAKREDKTVSQILRELIRQDRERRAA
jgi:hypothetical protein